MSAALTSRAYLSAKATAGELSRENVCSNQNRYGPVPIWFTQFKYCGMVKSAKAASLATFICTKIYTNVENTGSKSI